MTYSTLFLMRARPVLTTDDGPFADERYQPCGSVTGGLLLHGEPGAPIPPLAKTIYDGQASWTWDSFAREHPTLAANAVPHEYSGDRTTDHLDISRFTQEAARRELARTAVSTTDAGLPSR